MSLRKNMVIAVLSLGILGGGVAGIKYGNIEIQENVALASEVQSSTNKELYKEVSSEIKLPTKVYLDGSNLRSGTYNLEDSYEGIFLDEKTDTGTKIYSHKYISKNNEEKELYYYAINKEVDIDLDEDYPIETITLKNGVKATYNSGPSGQSFTFYDKEADIFYAFFDNSSTNPLTLEELTDIANSMY